MSDYNVLCKQYSGHTYTLQVVVYGGDMTELAVDVIVNASNKEMKHVGGLAAVIAKKGDTLYCACYHPPPHNFKF